MPTVDWEAFGALSTAVAAIASAVGAGAAWRAATTSRQTGQDALEALALAMRPTVVLAPRTLNGKLAVWVIANVWDATDLSLEAHVPRRPKIAERQEHLERNKTELGVRTETRPYWEVEIGTVTEDWPAEDETAELILRWSDARGIARYEQTCRWNLKPSIGPHGMTKPPMEMGEERRLDRGARTLLGRRKFRGHLP